MYYSAAWQLLEERVDYDCVTSPGTNRLEQEVWGIRYIDDPVLRLTAADGDPIGKASRYYHLTDVQFSTVAMIGMGSDVADEDQVNGDDKTALGAAATAGYHIYDTGYDVAMDLNRDGVIDSADDSI